MITVCHIEDKIHRVIELSDKTADFKAKINLDLGGSLQELTIEGKQILAKFEIQEYYTYYNSAMLFPFVNRIDNGQYSFKDKEYQLEINEVANNNALHGLIFNKKFHLKSKDISKYATSVTLEYVEKERNSGFPYSYKIQLIYTFSKKEMRIKFKIKNTDESEFPFTIGWHPYFYSSDLSKSQLLFKADKKVIHTKKMITKSIQDCNLGGLLELNKQNLDDCFHLKDDSVIFKTPEYHLELKSNQKNNYLQIFTPNSLNTIAIEPLTGISNSFNNEEGLQILKPNSVFTTVWTLSKIN